MHEMEKKNLDGGLQDTYLKHFTPLKKDARADYKD